MNMFFEILAEGIEFIGVAIQLPSVILLDLANLLHQLAYRNNVIDDNTDGQE